jgi:hypothetical protein
MKFRFQGGGTKLDALKEAVGTIASANESRLRMGAMLFPHTRPGAGSFDNLCGVSPPGVDLATGSAGAIRAYLGGAAPAGGTPTAQALRAALAYPPLRDRSRTNVVVLVTDGEPGCNDPASGGVSPANDTLAAVKDLAAASVRTYVVGLPDEDGFRGYTVLNALAEAGQTARPGPDRFYRVEDATTLGSTLTSIVASVASCVFQLKYAVAAGAEPSVSMDGQALPRDPTRGAGWDLDASRRLVTLYGATCDQLTRRASAAVTATYGCGR